ncbi:hypothetical protein COB11_08315 [Candidatus Aerophobetes bacterium]|uniref:Uncharacterized protein n=1 Tax=Aerophobetes bacterium TaxID=2030807 RepID=A0A2A4Y9T7_UNCAE|nr:MAG: hypothetical protein COB11_08315 [Candidatus Aerophobetes bacterium]
MTKSVQKKATEAGSILTRRKDVEIPPNFSAILAKHLKKAKVIKTPPSLQVIFKKSALKIHNSSGSKKGFAIFKKEKKGNPASLIKSIEDAEKCRNGQTFRLSYLKQLLLEEQIGLREYTEFRRYRHSSMRRQLQSIGKLIKDHYGDDTLRSKEIKHDFKKKPEELNTYAYKNTERDYTLTRITDFNKTS